MHTGNRVFLQTAAKHFSDTCMCSTDIDTFSSLPVCLQQRIHLHMLLKIASPSRACTSAAGLSWESGSTSYKTCCSPLSPTLFVHALKPWLTLLSCTALCPSPSFSSAQIPPIPQSQDHLSLVSPIFLFRHLRYLWLDPWHLIIECFALSYSIYSWHFSPVTRTSSVCLFVPVFGKCSILMIRCLNRGG